VSLKPTARRTGAAVAALAVAALSASCSLLPGASAAPAGAAAPETPAASAAPSPAPPVATPVEPADYGTRTAGEDGGLGVTLTGVHRITDDMALVSVSIRAESDQDRLPRSWYDPALRDTGDVAKDVDNTEALSAVTITAQGDPNVYATVTDGHDRCLCSQAPGYLRAGDATSGWAYVSLPAEATTVNVTVGRLEPWIGVPVS